MKRKEGQEAIPALFSSLLPNDLRANLQLLSPQSLRPAPKEANMARRRYQVGSVVRRGDVWDFRYREDVVRADGTVDRPQRRLCGFATVKECPTKRLALRHPEVKKILDQIQSPNYKPKTNLTFGQHAQTWKTTVLPMHKLSTQAAMKSQLKTRLLPALEDVLLTEISQQRLQALVAGWSKSSPKTVKNLVATLRLIWNTARDWGHVAESSDPFKRLVLPEIVREEQPCFSPEQVRKIINSSPEPYKTVWWLAAETGMRRGELCALQAGNVDCENCVVVVRKSNWNGNVGSTKSKKPRVFAISPQLSVQLKKFKEGLPSETFLFTNRKGKKLHPDVLVQRHLTPIVKKLKLNGAAHAFRHGNATILDSRIKAPMAVRQNRLGHAEETTTMGYTHLVGSDDHNVASQMYQVLFEAESK